jgi:hypothetical protein
MYMLRDYPHAKNSSSERASNHVDCVKRGLMHLQNSKIIMHPSHQRVYSGWSLTDIEAVDNESIRVVWECVNQLIQNTINSDYRDTVTPVLRDPVRGETMDFIPWEQRVMFLKDSNWFSSLRKS